MSERTRIVCFGELLVRLSGTDGEQLLQSPSLHVHFGGAEANVAVSLARFGHDAAMVSIVPPNALGAAAIADSTPRWSASCRRTRSAPRPSRSCAGTASTRAAL